VTGFSTRAIRASARVPRVDQHPTSVPIYQTATFASGDADELEGGRPAAGAVLDALTVPALTASLGSIHTMIVHPPSTTHRQLNDAELAAAAIGPGLLRCSIGLEHVDDLLADFTTGLEAARGATPAPATA
jgi:O-acetylhomoserine/O-acetylserine sulfhydrylase-like pyridoxal-dependent enzyme